MAPTAGLGHVGVLYYTPDASEVSCTNTGVLFAGKPRRLGGPGLASSGTARAYHPVLPWGPGLSALPLVGRVSALLAKLAKALSLGGRLSLGSSPRKGTTAGLRRRYLASPPDRRG